MRTVTLPGRRSLDIVFGLFLASGAMIGAYCLLALADWVHSQGEDAFGIFYLGMLSFVPSGLAWLAGGVHMLLGSRVRDVRLGVALITGHMAWWVILIGIELWRDDPSFGWVMRRATTVEPGLCAAGISVLSVRWFAQRRHHYPVQVAA